MEIKPLYEPHNLSPAYRLRYNWTGWIDDSSSFPENISGILSSISPFWEKDGIHLLEHKIKNNAIFATVSSKPSLSPVLICSRLKGRIQHSCREEGSPVRFSRKLSLRCIGENTADEVTGYIAKQVAKEELADERYREILQKYTEVKRSLDLSDPRQTKSGMYWYNLHFVLVVSGRYRIENEESFEKLKTCSFKIAEKKGYEIKALSVMPEHLHVALRGNIEQSPEEIVLAFQNNLAYVMGMLYFWEFNYYVGTFGEYDMGIVRHA
ncbi:MAG: transposase [Victivallales bacterium]